MCVCVCDSCSCSGSVCDECCTVGVLCESDCEGVRLTTNEEKIIQEGSTKLVCGPTPVVASISNVNWGEQDGAPCQWFYSVTEAHLLELVAMETRGATITPCTRTECKLSENNSTAWNYTCSTHVTYPTLLSQVISVLGPPNAMHLISTVSF